MHTDPRHGTPWRPRHVWHVNALQCTHPNPAHRRSANVIHSLIGSQHRSSKHKTNTRGRPSAVVVVVVVRLSPRKLLMAHDRRVARNRTTHTHTHTHTQAGRQAGSEEGGWGQVARPLHTPHGHHERGRVSSAQMHQQRGRLYSAQTGPTHIHTHTHHSIPLAPHTQTHRQVSHVRTLDRTSMGG